MTSFKGCKMLSDVTDQGFFDGSVLSTKSDRLKTMTDANLKGKASLNIYHAK